MNIKIGFLKTVCILILAVLFLSSCQKSTEPSDTSGDNGNGGNNVTPQITDIKAHGGTAIYLSSTGFVYSATLVYSAYGTSLVKAKVKGLSNIIKIACGPTTTTGDLKRGAALDNDGRIYVWNVDYTTGVPDSAVVYAKMSTFTAKIVDIALGGDMVPFAYALDISHRVWSWGYNSNFELGNGSSLSQETPALINGLPNDISAISAGAKQGVALSSNGNVYHWGTISPQNSEYYLTPALVTNAFPASKIPAGGNYNLSKKNDGTVFAWGHLNDGIIPGITNPTAIAAGFEMYFNPMFIKTDGTLWKTSFNMGTGNPETAEVVSELSAYRFSFLAISDRAFYVTTDGKILAQLSTGTAPIILNSPLQ